MKQGRPAETTEAELLHINAYREATLAGLEAVTDVATGKGAGNTLLNFTGEHARGKVGTAEADASLDQSIAAIRSETAVSTGSVAALDAQVIQSQQSVSAPGRERQ